MGNSDWLALDSDHPNDAHWPRISRYEFLKRFAGMGGVLLLTACGWLDEPEKRLGPLEELRAEGRELIFEWNGEDFFVAFDETGQPYALNLTCTHKQCTVAWKPEELHFVCPCHKGIYDRAGQVVKGKPPRPLVRYKLEERQGEWWLLNQELS